MSILEVRELVSGFGEVQILRGPSLDLQEGKLTCLVGGNGMGKTTLLRTVMGLLRPWSGSVKFEGSDVSRLPAHAKADMGMVLVPEGRQLFTSMSVYENLEMGAATTHARSRMKANVERVYTMFPRLKERREQRAGTLSGGEQQMLAVGRGIMAEPKVLMIDELSLGLAPVLVQQLVEKLKGLRDMGITILLVEQNVQMALGIADYGYVLSEGRVELQGAPGDLMKDEHVRAAYLGL